MKNKAVLLRSVSAIATAAASTAGGIQQANAQVLQPGAEGYYYSVTGGLGMTPSETFLADLDDKFGSFSGSGYFSSYTSGYVSGFDDFHSLTGSVTFGKQLDQNFDIRGSLSAVNGGSTSGWQSSYTFFSGYSYSNWSGGSSYSETSGFTWSVEEGTHKFGYAAADLEVGYTPVLSEDFEVRLFAGIRALAFKSTFEGMYSSYFSASSYYREGSGGSGVTESGGNYLFGYGFYGTETVKFTGIGPRVGAQMATRFEGTDFGISGSVAGAVLFGTKEWSREGTSSYYYSSGGSGSGSSISVSSSNKEDATVLDVQASIGLDYYLNDNTALTVGVQAEKLYELDPDEGGIDVTTTGVFAKLSGTF